MAKRRVLLVTEPCEAGVGRHVIDLATELSQRSNEVTVAYANKRKDALFAQFILDAPQLGIKLELLPMERQIGVKDIKSLLSLRNLIASAGPFDVVHGHSSKAGALIRLAVNKRHAKRIYTPHAIITMDPTLSEKKRKIFGRIEGRLSKRADRIIAVSEEEKDHMIADLGVEAKKVTVVPIGIRALSDARRRIARVDFGISDDEICIGFIGRLSSQKAPEVIIRAFAQVSKTRHKLKLVVIGDGPDRQEIESLVKEFQLDGTIILAGARNADEWIQAFDVLALSSRYEGTPRVILEALSLGIPVVTTKVGGTKVYETTDSAVIRVPIDDVSALASAIAQIVDNVTLRLSMRDKALEQFKEFEISRMVDRTEEVYDHS